MRYTPLGIGVAILLLGLPQIALAQEENPVITNQVELDQQIAEGEENALTGEGELGILNTTGNLEIQNISAALGLEYQKSSWLHQATFEALRSETETETAQRAMALFRSDYFLSPSKIDYLFGVFRYEKDDFSGYDYQSVLAAGYGRKLINTARIKFGLRGAIGIRQAEENESDETQRGGVAILGLLYKHQITAHSDFLQRLRTEISSDNTYGESETGFKVNLKGPLAFKLSFVMTHNTEVPSNKENTDTKSMFTLMYEF